MSTHNICFRGEIRYQHFSDEKSALSVAMFFCFYLTCTVIVISMLDHTDFHATLYERK